MEKGDIIKLQMDTFTDDGKLVETTDESKAKESGIYDEHYSYKPILTIVGSGRLFGDLEEDIAKANVGEEREVTIPPERAFGVRDTNNVRVTSYREVERALRDEERRRGNSGNEVVPEPGMTVRLGDKYGKILTVTAGRVVIDFNHPLAGKSIKYRYKILEKVEGEEKKIQSIIEINFPKDSEKFKIEVGDEIVITIPDSAKIDDSWPLAKFAIVGAIREYVANKTVIFREIFEKRVEEKKEEIKEEKEEAKAPS
ncbi:MAG: FKBP-type peptidyl-prolyl cis-trans isomerase [Thermoplasmata archaeon]